MIDCISVIDGYIFNAIYTTQPITNIQPQYHHQHNPQHLQKYNILSYQSYIIILIIQYHIKSYHIR